jgi:hypothetical protein
VNSEKWSLLMFGARYEYQIVPERKGLQSVSGGAARP